MTHEDRAKYLPTTSVEFETLTTEPAYGSDEVDANPQIKGGSPEWWKALDYYTRDLRLGNLSPRYHDIDFIWQYFAAASQIRLLRGGRFERVSIAVLAVSGSMVETSQSINGFFRKIARTVTQEQSYRDATPPPSGLFSAFKGGAKRGGGGGY